MWKERWSLMHKSPSQSWTICGSIDASEHTRLQEPRWNYYFEKGEKITIQAWRQKVKGSVLKYMTQKLHWGPIRHIVYKLLRQSFTVTVAVKGHTTKTKGWKMLHLHVMHISTQSTLDPCMFSPLFIYRLLNEVLRAHCLPVALLCKRQDLIVIR